MATLTFDTKEKRAEIEAYAASCVAKMQEALALEKSRAAEYQAEVNAIHCEAVKWEAEAMHARSILAFLAVEEERLDGVASVVACEGACDCAPVVQEVAAT